MSTPIIFGAGLVKLPKMLHEMQSGQGPVTWAALTAGFLAAAVVGVAVIRWMLSWLRTRTYVVFAAYRVALAAVIVVLWFSGKR
jgi:undecaprenyl-diphosphatase